MFQLKGKNASIEKGSGKWKMYMTEQITDKERKIVLCLSLSLCLFLSLSLSLSVSLSVSFPQILSKQKISLPQLYLSLFYPSVCRPFTKMLVVYCSSP